MADQNCLGSNSMNAKDAIYNDSKNGGNSYKGSSPSYHEENKNSDSLRSANGRESTFLNAELGH